MFAGRGVVLAPLVFFGVMLLGVGVEVRTGEDDFLAVGPEETARRLADAGADAAGAAALQVGREYLVEWVAGVLLLGLENDGLAVGREVAFAGADVVRGDLPDVF